MEYPADITGVTVTIGSAASVASKSMQCANRGGSTTCLVFGLNTTTIGNGEVATAALTIAAGDHQHKRAGDVEQRLRGDR